MEKKLEKILNELETLSLPNKEIKHLKKYQQKLEDLRSFIDDYEYESVPDVMIRATETYLHHSKKIEIKPYEKLNFLLVKLSDLGWKNEGLKRDENSSAVILDDIEWVGLKYQILYCGVYMGLASAKLHQGNFDECLKILNQINEEKPTLIGNENNVKIINIHITLHNNYGLLYRNIHEIEEARLHFSKAFKLLNLYNRDHTFDALKLVILINIAATYEKENKIDKAAAYLNENFKYATALLKNQPNVYLQYNYCQYLLMLSRLSGNTNDLKTQKKCIIAVEKILPNIKDHYVDINANYLFKKAALYAKEKNFVEALAISQKAFSTIMPHFKSDKLEDTPVFKQENYQINQFYIIQTYVIKASYLLTYYENEGKKIKQLLIICLDVVDKLAAYFDFMRNSYKGQKSKFSISEFSSKLFDIAQKACWYLYNKTGVYEYIAKAFNYANNSKALVLLEEMHQKWLKIKKNNLSITQVQSVLLDNEILIEYSAGIKGTFIYVLEKNTPLQFYYINVETTEKLKTLSKNFFLYYFHIFKNTTYISYQNESYEIFKALLKPYIKSLKQKTLILAPSGYLNSLPFEALVTTFKNKPIKYKQLHYLIDDCTVAYTFSANFLYLNRSKKPKRKLKHKHLIVSPNFLADKTLEEHKKLKVAQQKNIQSKKLVAMNYSNKKSILNFNDVTDFNYLEEDQQLLISKEMLLNLSNNKKFAPQPAPLFYNAGIIKKILNIVFDGEFINNVFENRAATLKAVDEKLKNIDLLLISSHAEMDKGILLYNNEDKVTFLSYDDLRNKSINAKLAILNMCDSGIGKKIIGEGYLSLGRALFSSGCLNVIQTLYKVSDKHSAIIIEQFYKSISKQKNNFYQALRKAKLKVRKEANSHPKFWAGHIIYGANGKF